MWLRLVSAPQDKASGKLWDGALDAQHAFGDLDGHRPALLAVHDVVDDGIAYWAELSVRVDQPVLSDGPILQRDRQLSDSWWIARSGGGDGGSRRARTWSVRWSNGDAPTAARSQLSAGDAVPNSPLG